jgi:hypothetical protein
VQDIYTIALADGTQEKYGYRHPLLTETGGKQAADSSEGDWVAVSPPPDLPDRDIPDDVLRVIGLALSDGGRKKGAVSYVITAHEPRIRDYLIAALDTMGDPWGLHTARGVPQGIRLNQGGQARACIEVMGIHEKLAADKVFPRELLGLSRRQAGILLGSLWEGDGAAYLGTPSEKTKKRPVRIMFSSRSRSLAEGVRHLLLQLGLLSNVTESQVVGAPYFQTVVVGRHNKEQFLRMAMCEGIDCPVSMAGGRTTRSGRVLESFSELRQELASAKKAPFSDRKRNPRTKKGIRWVKVKSASHTGQERCYDIEVPGPHTFLTGHCVVTHNTTSRLTKAHKMYYAVSGQMHAYLMMARETYDNVAGLKLNMIQHTNVKLERFDMMRSPYMESKFEQSIVDIEESVERMLVSGREYDDWPKAMSELTCVHRYGQCDFMDKCRHGANAMKGGNWTWSDQ